MLVAVRAVETALATESSVPAANDRGTDDAAKLTKNVLDS